jgi:hypothetical protein
MPKSNLWKLKKALEIAEKWQRNVNGPTSRFQKLLTSGFEPAPCKVQENSTFACVSSMHLLFYSFFLY